MPQQTDFSEFFYYYLAKQPIFDRRNSTYGYELLFRSATDLNNAVFSDGDLATMCVATSGFIKAQESIDQSKRIFVNFTENLLREGAPRALPASVTVIEILEDTMPLPEIKDEIIRLKQDGYFIAIDDFTGRTDQDDLLDLADIIKIDVLGKSHEEIEKIYQKTKDKKALKVAEKVEDRQIYTFVRRLGFDFFQGYYFARPETLSGKTLHTFQASRLRILNSLNDPRLDTEEIISLVNIDPSITYRLLRLLNSAAFGFSMKIESVRHAVTLLGNNRMRYWLRMIVLSDLVSEDKPKEILFLALNRGKFLEELTRAGGIRGIHPENMFLFGMLSLIDVMLEAPFHEIVPNLPLPEAFKEGYTDSQSHMAQYLHLTSAIEKGDSEELSRLCTQLNISDHIAAEASLLSGTWIQVMAGSMF